MTAAAIDSTAASATSQTSLAARRYLEAVASAGVESLVANAPKTHFDVVWLNGVAVPIVINHGHGCQCYFAAPSAHYVHYMREELERIPPSWTRASVDGMLWVIGALSGVCGFDCCVLVNHWLLSTGPTLRLAKPELEALIALLVRRFPRHAIVFRNVDSLHERQAEVLEALGCRLVLNRPVHWWFPERLSSSSRRKREDIRRELALLSRPGLQVTEDAVVNAEPLVLTSLYTKLYREKHSLRNPEYTARFFSSLMESGLCRFFAVSAEGRPVGFVAFSLEADRIIPVMLGYDTQLDRARYPVYRALIAALLRKSIDTQLALFLSTGAAAFKQQRGAIESWEYEAVYLEHLPPLRKAPWLSVAAIFQRAAERFDTTKL